MEVREGGQVRVIEDFTLKKFDGEPKERHLAAIVYGDRRGVRGIIKMSDEKSKAAIDKVVAVGGKIETVQQDKADVVVTIDNGKGYVTGKAASFEAAVDSALKSKEVLPYSDSRVGGNPEEVHRLQELEDENARLRAELEALKGGK